MGVLLLLRDRSGQTNCAAQQSQQTISGLINLFSGKNHVASGHLVSELMLAAVLPREMVPAGGMSGSGTPERPKTKARGTSDASQNGQVPIYMLSE